MQVLKIQANARLSCLVDVQVIREKDQVVRECLHDVLRDSSFRLEELKVICFHLEELEVPKPDCGSTSARMVGFITLVSDSYSESAKREFEEIVRHAREKAEWKLEKCPLIEQI